jgi:hypothetical protein
MPTTRLFAATQSAHSSLGLWFIAIAVMTIVALRFRAGGLRAGRCVQPR